MTSDDIVSQNFSNDATPTILGFEYQKLIALECCLKSKSDDIVYIECFGDVATSDVSIETKNRFLTYSMTNQSPDFWKTLRNYVREKGKISQFTKLILYTTAKLPIDSIFSDWNGLSGEEKFERLETIRNNPNKGIMDFVDCIYDFNNTYTKKDLIEILEKLKIFHSQKTISEKFCEIKNHPYLFSIEEKYREKIIHQMHGAISLKSIENTNRWEIVVSEFLRDLQFQIRRYSQDEIPFPDFPEEVEFTGKETFPFIIELREIELDNEIQRAFIDYIRAEKSSVDLLKWGAYSIKESIDVFESELNDRMSNNKKRHAVALVKSDLPTPKSIRKSKELYFDCKNFEKFKIRGVQEIQMYFQHGKMHKIVNDNRFVWKFLNEDVT